MVAHPSLIKRPVVSDDNDRTTVGFQAEEFARIWG